MEHTDQEGQEGLETPQLHFKPGVYEEFDIGIDPFWTPLGGKWERIPRSMPRLSADARRWLDRFAFQSPLGAPNLLPHDLGQPVASGVTFADATVASERRPGGTILDPAPHAVFGSGAVLPRVLGPDADGNNDSRQSLPHVLGTEEVPVCSPCGQNGGLFKAFCRELNPWEPVAEGSEPDGAATPLAPVPPDNSDSLWDQGQEQSSIRPLGHPATPTLWRGNPRRSSLRTSWTPVDHRYE